jgi:integrase
MMSGLPHYTIHDHRHSAAVALARAGMPLNLLQRQLGHKDISQTMQYAEFHPQYGDVAMYLDAAGRTLLGEKPSAVVPEGVPVDTGEEDESA